MIRRRNVTFALVFFVSGVSGAQAAELHQITIELEGMVCGFCSEGLNRSFAKIPGVFRSASDLDHQTLTLWLRRGTNLSDEQIQSGVRDGGDFTVKRIVREP